MGSLKFKRPAKTNLGSIFNDFGFRLFAQLAQQDAGQNIFLSPFSIAVALTAVMMQRLSLPPHRFTLRADRPFCFAIVDQQTGAMLFFGSVVNPT